MMKLDVPNLQALPQAAKELIKYADQKKIFLFFGEMGAGKTTFIKAICEYLGVQDHISSPTYSLVNEYHTDSGTIYHFDFYRLKSEAEAFDIGLEEYLASGAICLIEWPEKIESLWPETFVRVTLELDLNNNRSIVFSKN